MTDHLHDVLEQTADLAGPVGFDATALWRQGTGEKRRAGMLAVVGVTAVLALISLSLWWGSTATTPQFAAPPASTTIPAMPSHLYNPPAGVPTAESLAVGPLAAVFVPPDEDDVVAISALDGRYRRLALPGYDASAALVLSPVAALAPDGSRLAYGWSSLPPVSDPGHAPGGIRVVDLRSGMITTYPARGGQGPTCGGLSWSPDGRYLAATCFDHARGTVRGTGFEMVLERIDTRSRSHARQLHQGTGGLVAVDNAGIVAIPDAGSMTIWSPFDQPIFGQPVHWAINTVPSSAGWVSGSHGLVMMGGVAGGERSQSLALQTLLGSELSPVHYVKGVTGRVAGPVDARRIAVWVTSARAGTLSTFTPDGSLHARVTFEGLAPENITFATGLLRHSTRETEDPNALSAWDQVKRAVPYVALGSVFAGAVLFVVPTWRRERGLRAV